MTDKELVDKLKQLLKELFQFENNDLDFGIYRILNIKKNEISDFIEKDLFDIIKKEISTVKETQYLDKELEDLQEEIEKNFGCRIKDAIKKYNENPKIKDFVEKQKDYEKQSVEIETEEEIYNNIINFFSRYYDNGDFVSKRRYSKSNKYSIPYNGEEVYLYWANNDQYYIKTAETFRNYSFKAGGWNINYEIIYEDIEVEKSNIKDTQKKYFIFNSIKTQGKNIIDIRFGYRGLTSEEEEIIKKEAGKKSINKDYVNLYNLNRIKETVEISSIEELRKKHHKLNGNLSDKSELEWHLNKYTMRNTTDYFIHKNLKKYLSQELDFYIKNEMFQIDNLNSYEDLDFNLNKIKTFKTISTKLIEFLSQIEDFQKKLWEKKKFIISTDYCITLDYINEKYYPEIIKNKQQLLEWKKLFKFDIQKELTKNKGKIDTAFIADEEKLNNILKSNLTLVIDTKFYNIDFKYNILSEIENLDQKITAILFNSENFHVLNLLLNKYSEKIKCCYIDPPYNTGNDGFLYKDHYQTSSWLSFIHDRLTLAKELMSVDSMLITHIDEHEYENMQKLIDIVFGKEENIGPIFWNKGNPKGDAKAISIQHEFVCIALKSFQYFKENEMNLVKKKRNAEKIINKSNNLMRKFKDLDKVKTELQKWIRNQSNFSGGEKAYNIVDKNGRVYQKVSMAWPNKKKAPEKFFKPLIHPITNKPCPIPNRGWRYTPESMQELLEKDLIAFGTDESTQPRRKYYLDENMYENVPSYVYYAGSDDIFFSNINVKFDNYPKPLYISEYLLQIPPNNDQGIFLDFFAGSGTTGHAILNMNKNFSENRKFILVEMGKYFNSVLKQRLLKVIYSNNWKEGNPLDSDGFTKQLIKYHVLEQYEDTLNNIDFIIPNSLALNSKDYKIKYMLDFETKKSNVLLNIDLLDNPFEYKLEIEENNEIKIFNIDIIETFNYIAGIFVDRIIKKQDNSVDYIIVNGKREEKRVIVIWRNKNNSFNPKQDKEFVEKEIIADVEYDEIFVNGSSLIENAISLDELFKKSMLGE